MTIFQEMSKLTTATATRYEEEEDDDVKENLIRSNYDPLLSSTSVIMPSHLCPATPAQTLNQVSTPWCSIDSPAAIVPSGSTSASLPNVDVVWLSVSTSLCGIVTANAAMNSSLLCSKLVNKSTSHLSVI